MQFAELVPGQVVECGTYAVTEAEILEFASHYDPQPFHVDALSARRSRWGGVIASGFHTCAIAMRLVALQVLKDSTSFGSPGLDYLKWKGPVRAGDELRVRFEVLSTRVSSGRDIGIVRARWTVRNQYNEEVMELVGVSLFDLRESAPTTVRD